MTSPHGQFDYLPNIAIVGDSFVFPVPIVRLREAVDRIKKLAKKAKRLDVDAPKFSAIAKGFEIRRVPNGYHKDGSRRYNNASVPMIYYSVNAPKVKLAGWQFAARIEPLGAFGGSMIVNKNPGFDGDLPERFRHADNHCEHCNRIRDRKLLFVLRHDDGNWIQVGSTCLADFLGHDPKRTLRYLDWFYECERTASEYDGSSWGGISIYETRDFLAYTSSVIRHDGWQAKSSPAVQDGYKNPTVWTVVDCFGPPKKNYDPAEEYKPIEADYDRADKVLAWIRNEVDIKESKSDYEHNLCLALAGEIVDGRLTGIAASGVAAYMRHLNRLEEIQKKKESAGMSEFVGDIKERLRDIPVTVERVQHMSNDFGPVTLIKFRDDMANVLTWFASGDFDVEPGDKYMLTGTVKKHNEWKGFKETMVNRCKLEEVERVKRY